MPNQKKTNGHLANGKDMNTLLCFLFKEMGNNPPFVLAGSIAMSLQCKTFRKRVSDIDLVSLADVVKTEQEVRSTWKALTVKIKERFEETVFSSERHLEKATVAGKGLSRPIKIDLNVYPLARPVNVITIKGFKAKSLTIEAAFITKLMGFVFSALVTDDQAIVAKHKRNIADLKNLVKDEHIAKFINDEAALQKELLGYIEENKGSRAQGIYKRFFEEGTNKKSILSFTRLAQRQLVSAALQRTHALLLAKNVYAK